MRASRRGWPTPIHDRTSDVEAFSARCQSLPADKKVLIRSSGFQSGTISKARTHNIEILQLSGIPDGSDANARHISRLFDGLRVHSKIVGIRIHCTSLPPGISTSEFRSLYTANFRTAVPLLDVAQLLVARAKPIGEGMDDGMSVDRACRFKLEDSQYFIVERWIGGPADISTKR